MRKIDAVFKAGEIAVSTHFRFRYEIKHEGTLPRNGPYVLLPKHQKLLDIPLEGHYILRRTNRTANYVMREFPFPFNRIFEIFGGIQVARAKDLRKGKITKEEGQAINDQATQQALDCLANGEPLIIHPEGTRYNQEMGEIRIHPKSILARIIHEQAHIGRIPFIPMGIKYAGSQIWLRAGEPFYTNNPADLEEHLAKEIAKLSTL